MQCENLFRSTVEYILHSQPINLLPQLVCNMAKLSTGKVKSVFQDSIVVSFEHQVAITRLAQTLTVTHLKLFSIFLHYIAIVLTGNQQTVKPSTMLQQAP